SHRHDYRNAVFTTDELHRLARRAEAGFDFRTHGNPFDARTELGDEPRVPFVAALVPHALPGEAGGDGEPPALRPGYHSTHGDPQTSADERPRTDVHGGHTLGRQHAGLLAGPADRRPVGGRRTAVPFLRHVAAVDQHGHDRCDLPDGLSHPAVAEQGF